jgi:5-(carboxyamino)imidazole ribonucleotide synthase
MGTTDQSRGSLGILGGGQLGMMSTQAAKKLGIPRVTVWAQSRAEPAVHVADEAIIAPFSDPKALEQFVGTCDFVTTEFENVPIETVRDVESIRPMRPSARVMSIASNRWLEKRFFQDLGIPTTTTVHIPPGDEPAVTDLMMFPALLKKTTLGYDGLGQVPVPSPEELSAAHSSLGRQECVLERLVELECEFSIILVRDAGGTIVVYPPIENEHANGILRRSTWPATRVPEAVGQLAERSARIAAERMDLVGIVAFEFMLLANGGLIINEMAPRPHNSGHGTIEGFNVSQFEQHVRVSCGLPLVQPEPIGPWEMVNLIGLNWEQAQSICKPGNFLHWYNKVGVRPGRKMGHITRLL